MPAVSTSQRRFFAICQHDPSHAQGKCPAMPKSKMRDFSTTSEKGLPHHVSSKARRMVVDKFRKGKKK